MGVLCILSKKQVLCLLSIIIALSLISQVSASDIAVDDDILSQNVEDNENLNIEDAPAISINYTPGENDDLQKCIDDANDGDTIILNGNYTLKKEIVINKTISIVGAGDGAVITKNSFNYNKIRYFNINSSNVILNNLKFIGGENQYGGAVYWNGDNGIIINCQFKDNIVVNDGCGGAIMVAGNNFSIENSSFTNNRATKGTGGAIYISGEGSIIKNCQFEDNKADNGSAGAIALLSGNSLVENCWFTDNYCNQFGGAIAVYNKSNKVSNSIFTNNQVKNILSDQSGGGAIYSDCENLIVDNSTFLANEARTAYGGAIYTTNGSTVQNSIFKNNLAKVGNAIYAISFLNLSSNYFALKYNETHNQAVNASDFIDDNNTFEEIKEDSSVTFVASMVFEYASSGSIYVTVEGGRIDLENISIINHTGAEISFNDSVLTVSKLAVGEYVLRVITTPDEAHNSVESFLPITVKKATAVISASKITVALKKGNLWSIKIINSQTKKPIANIKVTLKVYTGSKYKKVRLTTNSKGIVTYQTKNLAQGTHKIVVSANHAGYNFNTLTSSIKVIKPTPLTFKVTKTTNENGALLSIHVYKKSTQKPINGVKVKLLIYSGKKVKTVVLKTKTNKGFKGVCGFGTNNLSIGTHKVVLQLVDIKYSGSTTSKMTITKNAKKKPVWTKKISG